MSKRWTWRLAAAGAVLLGIVSGTGALPAEAAAPQWLVVPNTVGTAPADAAVAVSCVSASSCLAVTKNGGALSWNGTGWSDVSPTGLPAFSSFTAISCATTTFCVATATDPGSATVSLWKWTGVGWSAMPAPTGTVPNALGAVSCPTTTFCAAAGGTSVGRAIVLKWNGTSWTGQVLPQAAQTARYKSVAMTGVSCFSSTACVAVGTTTVSATPLPTSVQTNKPFASAFDGTRWTLHAAPASPAQANLLAVSCWAAHSCAAVGQGFRGSSLLTYTDGKWTQAAHPGSTNPVAAAVSCVDATHCVAVGYAVPSGNVHRWNGSTWSTESAGLGSLAGVSCVAGNTCTAVGGGTAEQGSGNWAETRLPVSQTAVVGSFNSISCATSSSCVAVGGQQSGGADEGLVSAGDASGWSTSTVAPSLRDVDCPDTSACFALAQGSGVIVHDATGRHLLLGSPAQASVLSCATTAMCLTVNYPTKNLVGAGFHNVVTRWNGTKWAAVASLKAASGARVTVEQLNCPTASFCLAVGQKEGPADGTVDPHVPFAATWNGSGWTERTVPGAAATQSELTAVTCLSATTCLAVGTSGADAALLEYWTGGAFTPVTAPAGTPPLTGVGCRNTSACVAVARLDSRSLVWDGASWTLQPIAAGPVGGQSWLEGVTCTADACFGVGEDKGDPSGDVQVPLVERLS